MTLKDKKLMKPLWLKYPDLECPSIGWRMGSGEDYAGKFWGWFNQLTDEEKEEYKKLFPEPFDWKDAYCDDFSDGADVISFGDSFAYKWEFKYGKEWLEKEMDEGKNKEFFIFSINGSTNNEKIDENCFGLDYETKFSFIEKRYSNINKYIQARKEDLFLSDEERERRNEAYYFGEVETPTLEIENFDEKVWEQFRYTVLLDGLWRKFFENKDLRDYLLSTNDQVLVYADSNDSVYGIGLSKDSLDVKNPKKWNGENLLGFGLMIVRDELRRVTENESLAE